MGVKNANGGQETLHLAGNVKFHRPDDSDENTGLPVDHIHFEVMLASKRGKNEKKRCCSHQTKLRTKRRIQRWFSAFPFIGMQTKTTS
jgi:hypothetical protein